MEDHDHDPTLDPRTCRRIDALESAVMGLSGGTVVPFQPIAPDMQTRLAEHNARVQTVIDDAAKTFQSITRSDNERIAAIEARMEVIESILRRVAEQFDQEAGDK